MQTRKTVVLIYTVMPCFPSIIVELATDRGPYLFPSYVLRCKDSTSKEVSSLQNYSYSSFYYLFFFQLES